MKTTYTRRQALKTLALGAATISLPTLVQAKLTKLRQSLRFGMITDTHIGFMKDAEQRLDAFLKAMQQVKPDALIQLGDFANPNANHQPIVDRFNAANENVIHVIGNHELDHGLTREDAKQSWGMPGYYYTKTVGGVKIIVLDGNDRGSPTYKRGYHSYIGPEQIEWLKRELDSASEPVLVLSHQALAGNGAVDNAAEIQKILSSHRDKVIMSVNGHTHIDRHVEIDGINYLHINSASYHWVRGKTRFITYKDPLFTTMTIDPQNASVSFTGVQSEWVKTTPEEAGYFETDKGRPIRDYVKARISPWEFKQIPSLG